MATAADARGSIEEAQLAAISRWMTTDSAFRFLCPSCRQEVIPDLPRCAQGKRVDIIDFRAEARPAAD